ncbi:MAG: MFS transporter [Methylibium sp.]|uniref:MFS transporter n=1 Tax=Methylibium sp. TaxID=2067992 RepID=UPI0017A9FBB2|nr:MFS transporter [Methylibium sp.]MBA3598473.1 MFS transporter [Methylibium sp.]
MTTTVPVAPAKASRREWVGLAVIALPCLLYSMDLTVLNLAVPALSAALQPSAAQLLWIVDIYGFMVAGALITMGTLGDRIGRRRLLMIGAAAFGIASVLAAFSTSAEMLIATRALLGLAGATLAPSTLSLIRNMFHDPGERTLAIGIWVSSYSVGAAIGPLIGGVLLEYFWWGSVFLVGVPVMLLLLIVGPVLLPEFRDPQAGPLDLLSAALSLVAVLATIYGLKQMAEQGPSVWAASAIVAGVGLGAAFLRRQHGLADPLIDLKLFRRPAFNASLATYTLGCYTMFGAYIFIAQYLQLVLGLSPLVAGLWTVPWGLAFVVGSMLTPMLVRRFRPADVVAAGLAIAAAGFALLAQAQASHGPEFVIGASVVLSLGLAPVFTLATDLIVGAAPPERAGAAAAISETSAEFGGALGIAIFGSIGAAVYRSFVIDGLPASVPPEALDAARSTLGAASTAAARLPADVGAGLLATSREGFMRGLRLNAWIAVAIMSGTAILAATVLRRATGAHAGSGSETADAERARLP